MRKTLMPDRLLNVNPAPRCPKRPFSFAGDGPGVRATGLVRPFARFFLEIMPATLAVLALLAQPAVAADPVPALRVVPCAQCRINPAIIQLIERTYEESVDYEGLVVNSETRLLLQITEFAERTPEARALAPLGGKDHIRATLSLHGETFVIEDSAISSFSDMSTVAENIGIDAAKRVVRAAKQGPISGQ